MGKSLWAVQRDGIAPEPDQSVDWITGAQGLAEDFADHGVNLTALLRWGNGFVELGMRRFPASGRETFLKCKSAKV